MSSKKDNRGLMMHEVQGYADKHGVIHVPVPMYMIEAYPGVTLEYTHLLSLVQKAWKETKCRATLYKVINNKKYVLEQKNSLPMMSYKKRMSYGNLTTK